MSDLEYSPHERRIIDDAKFYEKRAKELRKQANETRRERTRGAELARQAALALEAEKERARVAQEKAEADARAAILKAEQARKDKELRDDFDDRLRVALSQIGRALKDAGLKIQGNSWNSQGTPPIHIVDTRARLTAYVKVVEGKGWEW